MSIKLAKAIIKKALKSGELIHTNIVLGKLAGAKIPASEAETAVRELGVKLIILNGINYWKIPVNNLESLSGIVEIKEPKINMKNTIDFLEQTIDETFTQPIYGEKERTFTTPEAWEQYLKECNTGETIPKPVYERTNELTDKQLKPLGELYNS
jgi:hypothetical protein